jgi:hypothetical protein
MLFNIVADMLAIIIQRAKVDCQIEGVADDTILFMDHDLEKVRNLKLILRAFKQLSGLNINSIKVNCSVSVRPKTMPTCRVVRMWAWLFSD